MNINFELFKVFYFCAELLSYSDAAKKLYVTQSAISQSIKQLENHMDTKLFTRHGKSMQLTPQGEILFQYVKSAYNSLDAGFRVVNEYTDLSKGSIRIGASDTISKYFLIEYLRRFKELYPKINITITNKPSPECIELVKNNVIDLAIVNINSSKKYTGFEVSKLKEIRDTFIAGKNYEYLNGQKLSIRDLAKYPILSLDSNSTTRYYYDKLMKLNDTYITPEFELQSVDLLIEMTKASMGIAFVMDFAIQNKLRTGEVFEVDIEESIEPRYIGLITKEKSYITPAARRFIEILKDNE